MSKPASYLRYMVWRSIPDDVVAEYHKIATQLSDFKSWNPPQQGSRYIQNSLRQFGEWTNLFPGEYPGGIPNHPSPLAAMLLLGLVGGGLGYGATSLIGKLLPDTWDKGKLQRTGFLGGALLGATPGLLKGLTNVANKDRFNSTNAWSKKLNAPKPTTELKDYLKTAEKCAVDYMNTFGGPGPFLDVDAVNRTIWGDPEVAPRLDLPTQAATSGLVSAAANLPGKPNTRLVTPIDMARMTAGMGSGYISGAIVGKVLGTLFGMPQGVQDRLKQTGAFAGAIANVVPLAFGG